MQGGHPAWPGVPDRPAQGGAGLGGGTTRRALVRAGGAGAAVAAVWACLPPAIAATSVDAAVEELLAGRALVESARLHIDLPPQFEYGTTVPLAVTVDSPMTEADHVRRVSVFADRQSVPGGRERPFHAGQRPRQRLDPDPAQRGQAGGGRGRGAERWSARGSAGGRSRSPSAAAAPRPAWRSAMLMPRPEPRLKVPVEARRHEIVEIRTMISHWMETGLRIDAAGNPIPRRIINQNGLPPRRRADLRRRPDPGHCRERLSELSRWSRASPPFSPSPGARTAAPSTAPATLLRWSDGWSGNGTAR